jgi:GNAT superfamily N-acetyltransferase
MMRGDLDWDDRAYDTSSLSGAIDKGSLFIAESATEGMLATFRLEPEDLTQWGAQPPVAMYIQRFATTSGFRGQRLGGQIFDIIGEFVRSNGRHFIRLTCPAKNVKLCAYHESNGFTRADFKAKPLTFSTPVAYYERAVDPEYQEPQAVVKQSLFNRLRRSK